MRKTFLSVLVLVLLFTVTGCGSNEISESNKKVEELKCDDGYVKKDDRCVKVEFLDVTYVYECPENAKLNSNSLTCKLITESIAAKNKKTCPSGYKLSGSKCTMTQTVPYTITEVCFGGGVLQGGVCKYFDAYGHLDYSHDPAKKKDCPTGYSDTGSKCGKTTSVNATNNYSCSEGYELSGSNCIKTQVSDAKKVAKCPDEFELVDDKCIKYIDDSTEIDNGSDVNSTDNNTADE